MLAIKNYHMPKDCDSCPFYTYRNDAEDTCKITGEGLYHVKIGERHKKCPLVAVDDNSEKTHEIILLPCPFCGNENIHMTKKPLWQEYDGSYHGYKDRYAFEVVCDKCGAHPAYYKNDTIYRSEEEAISNVVNKWNKRGSE